MRFVDLPHTPRIAGRRCNRNVTVVASPSDWANSVYVAVAPLVTVCIAGTLPGVANWKPSWAEPVNHMTCDGTELLLTTFMVAEAKPTSVRVKATESWQVFPGTTGEPQ